MFLDVHAAIVIFGGSFAATLIRFPLFFDLSWITARGKIQKIAPQLKAMPYRLSIVRHTASSKVPPKPGYGPWDLSADRANAVRQILEAEGVPPGNIFMVAGKADTDPLFPDDPSMSPNRRVTITLMREEPPLPENLTP